MTDKMTAREYLKGLSDKDLIMLARWFDDNHPLGDKFDIYLKFSNIEDWNKDEIMFELADRLEASTVQVVNIPTCWIDGERPANWTSVTVTVTESAEPMIIDMKEREKK